MTMMTKRLNYECVRITTIGGTIECKTSPDGWSIAFIPGKEPRTTYGKTLEEVSENLVKDLRRVATCVEEDLKAFTERNR